jgi:hypothetical protein
MQSQPDNLVAQEQQPKNTPLFLYIFSHVGVKYHLGEPDLDVIISGLPSDKGSDPQSFQRAQIQHQLGEQSAENIVLDSTIKVAMTDSPESAELRKYFLSAPLTRIGVQIIRVNASDYSAAVPWADCYTVFKGTVNNLSFSDYIAVMTCKSLFANLDRKVPRFFYQKTCQHVLFGEGCNVNGSNPKERFAKTVTVSALDRINRAVTIDLVATDSSIYEGGWFTDQFGNYIAVMAAESVFGGTTLFVHWWPATITVGAPLTVYRGCKRIVGPGGCADFSNTKNFGGTPYIPSNNIGTDGIQT